MLLNLAILNNNIEKILFLIFKKEDDNKMRLVKLDYLKDINIDENNYSKYEAYITKLKALEEKSTCLARKVGCIIIDNNFRLKAMEINQSLQNFPSCKEYFNDNNIYDHDKHKEFSSCYEIHAEMAALAYLLKVATSSNNLIMLCSYSPCRDCAKMVIASGIKNYIFIKPYESDLLGLNTLIDSRLLTVYQVKD